MNIIDGAALGGHGHPIFQRDGFTCVYCGFDGSQFDGWRQLSVGRLRPAGSGGTDSTDNLVTACHFCTSATSRMTFSPEQSAGEIRQLKQDRVAERLKVFRRYWSSELEQAGKDRDPSKNCTCLPNPLLLNFDAVEMTDDQFLQLCSDNSDVNFELTAQRELVVMPPVGSETGWKEVRIILQVALWAEKDKTGRPFSPSAGFTLPNGAIRSPDASWILSERWDGLPAEDREKYAHICPDFVLELRSPSDRLAVAQSKMTEYLENGARLGWLIDPLQRRVYVYRPGEPVQVLEVPATVSGEPVLPGFELDLREIWEN